MERVKRLDVREIDKKYRKKIILNLFDELPDRQSLELISDHSLAPLQKLFKKEKQGFFEWHENRWGPDIWKTAITKTSSLNLTINDILKNFPAASNTLERRGIPYYKYGNERLSSITKDAKEIYEEITQGQQFLVNPLRTDRWSVSFTVDYIINNHHTYIRESIPEIESLIEHLAKAHASSQPQLPMISARFQEFKGFLEEHLKDEEDIVFPSFKALESAVLNGKETDKASFQDSINWMEEDHILSGTTLKSLRNFCNNYVPPEDSSPGFKILYEELKKFESDLHFHMHLENNILFTKVVELYTKLNS